MQISWLNEDKSYHVKTYDLPAGAQRTYFADDGSVSVCESDEAQIYSVTENLLKKDGGWWYEREVSHSEQSGPSGLEIAKKVPVEFLPKAAAKRDSLWKVKELVIPSGVNVDTIWANGVVVFDVALDGGE